MNLLVKLGWRNIWRNKRRSIITILAVTFAVMLSIAMRGIQLGTYKVNIKNAIELYSGYLQIQEAGYRSNPSLQRSFRYGENLQALLEPEKGIVAYSPRIEADGLISGGDHSLGAAIIGVVPESEIRVSEVMKKINQGRFFTSDTTSEIVVGYKLLDNLNARIGDEVVVLAQGYDGTLGNLKFKIVGTIKTGSPEFDGVVIFMGLSTARELLMMYGRVSIVALRLQDLDIISSVHALLNRSLSETGLRALSWDEVSPDLKQIIELDNISGILFLGILIVVVAFGITNTVLMSVTERFREFGITLSIGMPQKILVQLVLVETLFIVVIGLMAGNLLGAGINYYIVQHPIVLSGQYEALYVEYGWLPRIESTMQTSIFVNSSLATLLIAVLASIYPLLKVYKLEPLKGIRYT